MGGRNTRRWPAPCLGPHISKAIEDRPIRPWRNCLRWRHGRRPLPGIGTDGVRVFTRRSTRPLLLLCRWDAPDKGSLHLPCPGLPREGGHPLSALFGPQLPHGRGDHGRGARGPGLNDPGAREMVQLGVSLVRQDIPGPPGPALTDARGYRCAREIGLLGQHVDTRIPMSHRSLLYLRSLPVAVCCFHGCLSQPGMQQSFFHVCTGTLSGYYNFVL